MALVDFQMPYEAFSGRDSSKSGNNGSVLFKVGERPVARQFVRPKNPRTQRQLGQRSAFGYFSTLWNTLTNAEQATWYALGATIDRVDRLGRPYTLSGKSAFVEAGSNATFVGDSPTDTAGATTAAPAILSITSVSIDNPATQLVITFSSLAVTGHALLSISPPLQAGQRAFYPYLYRVAASSPDSVADLSVSNTTFTVAVADLYFVPAVGDRIQVKLKPFDDVNFISGLFNQAILTVVLT